MLKIGSKIVVDGFSDEVLEVVQLGERMIRVKTNRKDGRSDVEFPVSRREIRLIWG